MTPSTQIEPLTVEGCYSVLERMREADAEEVFGLRFNDRLDELAGDCMACAPFAYQALDSEGPQAIIGAQARHPTLWQVWMIGTDQFNNVGLAMTKFTKRKFAPALIGVGALRAQCYSLDTHISAHKWLEAVGAEKEAVLPAFGKQNQTYFLFSWLPYVRT
jgi:hypothetical protein